MEPSDDVYAEHTLLIDPCFDDPEDYLGYDPTGQIFSLNDNPYGEKTIDVLHLSRRRLTLFRREIVQMVRVVLKLIANVAIAANASAAKDLKAFLENIQTGKSQHAGIARYVAENPAEFGV